MPRRVMFVCVLVGMSGCSAFQPGTQSLTVRCSEPDALATIHGESHPVPAVVTVPRNKPCEVKVTKDGFKPFSDTVFIEPSLTGFMDGIGMYICLCPGIGLLTPGAWSLTQSELNVRLEPAGSPNASVDLLAPPRPQAPPAQ